LSNGYYWSEDMRSTMKVMHKEVACPHENGECMRNRGEDMNGYNAKFTLSE